jgi:hypothetical protein
MAKMARICDGEQGVNAVQNNLDGSVSRVEQAELSKQSLVCRLITYLRYA